MQEDSCAQCNDGNITESDEDSSWTDVSSDGDLSTSSVQDCAAVDSDGSNNIVGGKNRSQHNHSSSNVHGCRGEKLASIVYLSLFIRLFVAGWKMVA